jgi:hypothetical protein
MEAQKAALATVFCLETVAVTVCTVDCLQIFRVDIENFGG